MEAIKRELVDAVNDADQIIGAPIEKAEAHRLGLRHRDVRVWLTNGTDALEQERDASKKLWPGLWDITAGHVDAGESYLEAARREVLEELGIDIAPERFIPAGVVAEDLDVGWSEPHRTIGENFVVYTPELALGDLTLRAGEVSAARWYPIDQLEADLAAGEGRGGHAPHSAELYALGIAAMRGITQQQG